MSNERWERVDGLQSNYEVSTDGQVREIREDGTILLLPLYRGGPGYLRVWIDGEHRAVHVMMLEAFIGPRPNGCQAAHLNRDPSDNRLENLGWRTHYELRLLDAGQRHPVRRLADTQIEEIRASTEPCAEIAARFGIHANTVSRIRCGRSRRTPRRYVTDAERAEIVSSQDSGAQVARRLGLNVNTVYSIRRQGGWRRFNVQQTLSLEQVQKIRISTASNKALAQIFGCSPDSVWNVRRGKSHAGFETAVMPACDL